MNSRRNKMRKKKAREDTGRIRKPETLAILKLSSDNIIEIVRKRLLSKMGEIGPVELSAEYKIFVSSKQSIKEQIITIIHELFHVIENMVGDGTKLVDPEDYDRLAYFIYNMVSAESMEKAAAAKKKKKTDMQKL